MFVCKVFTLLSLGMVIWSIMWPFIHNFILITRLEPRMVELENISFKLIDMQILLDKQKRSLVNIENSKMKIHSLVNNVGWTQRKQLSKILKYILTIICRYYFILYLCRTYFGRRQVSQMIGNHIIRKVSIHLITSRKGY